MQPFWPAASLETPLSKPTFGERAELVRYVDPVHRNGNRYASPAAFEFSPRDLASPKPFLSVDSTEVQAVGKIAERYRAKSRQGGAGVSFCIHKVGRYVSEGKKAGEHLRLAKAETGIVFEEAGAKTAAFEAKGSNENPSHCAVHFVRALDENARKAFAMGMASKPRYQVL